MSSLRAPAAPGASLHQYRRFLPAAQTAQLRLVRGPQRVRGVAGRELSAIQSRTQGRESHTSARASLRIAETEVALSMDPALVSVPPPPHPTYDIAQTVKQALEEDFGSHGSCLGYTLSCCHLSLSWRTVAWRANQSACIFSCPSPSPLEMPVPKLPAVPGLPLRAAQGTSRAWRPSQRRHRRRHSSWPRPTGCWRGWPWRTQCSGTWTPP